MYRFLQFDLRKYRMLLLLPFLISHLVFYLSLPFPRGEAAPSLKVPAQAVVHNPGIATLQLVKSKQSTKNVAGPVYLMVLADRSLRPSPEPAPVVYRYRPSRAVAAFHPPRLFPKRAPPA